MKRIGDFIEPVTYINVYRSRKKLPSSEVCVNSLWRVGFPVWRRSQVAPAREVVKPPAGASAACYGGAVGLFSSRPHQMMLFDLRRVNPSSRRAQPNILGDIFGESCAAAQVTYASSRTRARAKT